MERGILKLETFSGNSSTSNFRTVIKTQHGRTIFLAVEIKDSDCTITDCFYTDRNQSRIGAVQHKTAEIADIPIPIGYFDFSNRKRT